MQPALNFEIFEIILQISSHTVFLNYNPSGIIATVGGREQIFCIHLLLKTPKILRPKNTYIIIRRKCLKFAILVKNRKLPVSTSANIFVNMWAMEKFLLIWNSKEKDLILAQKI